MPVVLRIDGFKFLFYGNEGNPREPVHVHVKVGRDEAKFWISPKVVLTFNRGLNSSKLNRAQKLVEDNREELERAWNDFFA
ncbi:MAG: DUF4160 domain-containing protein [Sphingomonadaceae bacterium]